MAIVRGDAETWTLTLVDALGAPFDLTDCEVFVTYKSAVTVEDAAALFQHWIKIAAGVVTDQDGLYLHPDGLASGKLLERLDPAESAAFAAGSYVYDVQVGYPSPDVEGEWDIKTPIKGATDTVVADVTITAATPGV
jgi:hypothetical protein